jgi:hypothetical protein
MGQVLAADAAVDAVHRSDWGRIVASLKLATNDAERRFLERRLHEVQEKRR